MKVVILCGGKGTRLREETEYRPKVMLPIGGRPILWHIMKYYSCFGHDEFILCLGYKGEMIKEFFRNYRWNTCDVTIPLGSPNLARFNNRHSEENWTVTLADTGEESMTAYRVRSVRSYIPEGEPFLLTYGDGLSTIDINTCIQEHERSGQVCTISAVHPSGRFGALSIDDKGDIHTFDEKPQSDASFINGGYMVCKHEMFNYLPDDPSVMLEREPMMNLVADKQLHSFRHSGFWHPMDTYKEHQYLNALWASGKAPWKIW
ncbi:MAG: glucose-1-phosphate cytidylyltransferase [Opitutales bacterium]|nr:glucose-1-phosphate cytidylyltransferase [Opitutales bacterium]